MSSKLTFSEIRERIELALDEAGLDVVCHTVSTARWENQEERVLELDVKQREVPLLAPGKREADCQPEPGSYRAPGSHEGPVVVLRTPKLKVVHVRGEDLSVILEFRVLTSRFHDTPLARLETIARPALEAVEVALGDPWRGEVVYEVATNHVAPPSWRVHVRQVCAVSQLKDEFDTEFVSAIRRATAALAVWVVERLRGATQEGSS